MCVCVCVCICVCVCVFFPFILDIKFVGRTSRGHTGGRSHRISHPPSLCGAYFNFSRAPRGNEVTARSGTGTFGKSLGSSPATVRENVPVCVPRDGNGTGRREGRRLTGWDGN